jgi:hypothetical protein
MAATAQHIAAYSPRLAIAALTGRRRILERHAPRPVHVRPRQINPLCERNCTIWPCPDYRDAAGDLLPAEVTG